MPLFRTAYVENIYGHKFFFLEVRLLEFKYFMKRQLEWLKITFMFFYQILL